MKKKSFDDYLKKRLNQDEIKSIEAQALLEKEALVALQKDIAGAIETYVLQQKIGFNELVRRLDISPSQVLKIQKGQANLTLATLAHIAATLKWYPSLQFRRPGVDFLSEKGQSPSQ